MSVVFSVGMGRGFVFRRVSLHVKMGSLAVMLGVRGMPFFLCMQVYKLVMIPCQQGKARVWESGENIV